MATGRKQKLKKIKAAKKRAARRKVHLPRTIAEIAARLANPEHSEGIPPTIGSNESTPVTAPPRRKVAEKLLSPDVERPLPLPEIPDSDPIAILRLTNHGIWTPSQRLKVAVILRYGTVEIEVDHHSTANLTLTTGQTIRKIRPLEQRLFEALRRTRCLRRDTFGPGTMADTRKFITVGSDLKDAGWQIESQGKPVRISSAVQCRIKSGIDWFDLRCQIRFDEVTADVYEIYKKLAAGERMIQLSDGSFAIIPVTLTDRLSLLFELAEKKNADTLRFRRSQALLLDAIVRMNDTTFEADRAFQGIKAALENPVTITENDDIAGFSGELRGYQRQGLSWLLNLHKAEFGGCLADDMGLGKTIQILAMLVMARSSATNPAPSLIVVPRSLVINWQREIERFTPSLSVRIHHGSRRELDDKTFKETDILITTYGTLRNDAPFLAEIEFDTCILDEAQAIKNPGTLAAKAVRTIRARRRFALTGTPIENYLGDLWSIFEFLNPGILGTGPRFRRLIDDPALTPDAGTLSFISEAIRPFLLRRTKKQVLTELPEKTEMTIYCQLEGAHKKTYFGLREKIREEILGEVAGKGLNRSKIKVIEALLRLRQCACHPGLIDKKLIGLSSAKIEFLLDQLSEISGEGHKTLVFSQFTSFLALVRKELDALGIPYEYLDGKTRNRQERVDRFQNDPDCRIFLISLKAGGLGLNLTAAAYVYILDPWWNPAAEAQAIDRAHRIGQVNKVFAYRIIAKDTIEEKVLALQERKHDLATAILTADKSLMKKLDADDLRLLLS